MDGGRPGLGWHVAVNNPQAPLCSAHLHLLRGEAQVQSSHYCFIPLSPDVMGFVFPDTLTWSQPKTQGKPPSPRHGHVMVAAGTKLFIHGGLAGDNFYDDLHCIDISKQGRGHGGLLVCLKVNEIYFDQSLALKQPVESLLDSLKCDLNNNNINKSTSFLRVCHVLG